ncbi:D-glycero-beta-D-manno-heptose 1,7-bisphosphate 7-phosphatase [Streptomyces amakusaensis]|uniref:D,D-heptose 1,7-bisphosphate phosphatase n=1 Tax=Streptomyces amakusaensis TaxID=67271 RepID=A0ABW0AN78_9ACTN
MTARGPATFFLDRDGTVNVKAPDGQYVCAPEELRLLPGAAAAIRHLNRHGRRVVVVTNQRGVALGLMSRADLESVEKHLAELLWAEGAYVDAYYACIHHRGECDCRKPAPGLLLTAAREIPGVSLGDAVMIGDSESDVRAGRAAGCATVRLAPPGTPSAADHVLTDLRTAVETLMRGDR